MSRARLPRHDVLTALTNELRQAGYQWREKAGGKHGKLIVSVNGREESIVVSTSPSDHRAGANALGWLRRRIREWKAEEAPFKTAVIPQPEEKAVHRNALKATPVRDDLTMSSREIAELVNSRHDKVKQSIDRLASRGVIDAPPLGEYRDRLGRPATEYRVCKRDSYVIVAQLSPEFTARLVDRWQELEDAVAAKLAVLPNDWDRMVGMLKMLAHKVTTTERSLAAIEAYLTDPHTDVVPALDLAGTVTSLMVIEMAGVPADERVRGTSAVVTRHLKDFCLRNTFGAFPTPEHIDSDKRWRFPREAATEWLIGEARGAEIIRSHVARQRARLARKGQMALELVGSGR